MRIVVAGCGKIGEEIVASLVEENHEVIVIDTSRDVLDDAENTYDIVTVQGNCADIKKLREADVENCKFFIAMTGSDEVNMISSVFVRQMNPKAHIFARLRSPEYSDESVKLIRSFIDIKFAINPDKLAAEKIFNIVQFPSAFTIETFSRRYFRLVELKLKENSALNGIKIADLKKNSKYSFLICAVQRGDEVYIPSGDFVLKSGDKIGIAGTQNELVELFRSLKLLQKEIKDVLILGGSRTAYYLAKNLVKSTRCNVKIIEKELDRCMELSEEIDKIEVIHGDATDRDLLLECGIEDVDAVINLTGIDELNILMGFYANSLGVDKVIAKVNHKEFTDIAEKIGLDSLISPQNLVADVIVSNVRSYAATEELNIETMRVCMDERIEALEFIPRADFEYFNVKIRDLRLRKNILIAGIIRNKTAIVPNGNDSIMPGDNVVIISYAAAQLSNLSDIFE